MLLWEAQERELKLRARAGQVMSELKEQGGDWQSAWRDHPVAREYRQLLKDAWASTLKPGGHVDGEEEDTTAADY